MRALALPAFLLVSWPYFAAEKRLSNEFDDTIGWAPATTEL